LKDERSQETDARLEIHNALPKFMNGDNDVDNEQALTLPEHAIKHHELAWEARDRRERDGNNWAVRAIISRMSESELGDFNDRLKR